MQLWMFQVFKGVPRSSNTPRATRTGHSAHLRIQGRRLAPVTVAVVATVVVVEVVVIVKVIKMVQAIKAGVIAMGEAVVETVAISRIADRQN